MTRTNSTKVDCDRCGASVVVPTDPLLRSENPGWGSVHLDARKGTIMPELKADFCPPCYRIAHRIVTEFLAEHA